MGARTTTLEGDRFAPDASTASMLFILGATEAITPADAQNVRKFVAAGGTPAVATGGGVFERPLPDAVDVPIHGVASPRTPPPYGPVLAAPPPRALRVARVGSPSLRP